MLSRCFRRTFQTQVNPPSHFGSSSAPPDFSELTKQNKADVEVTATEEPRYQGHKLQDRPIKELTSLVAMVALGYFAVDNYLNRIRLEKLNNESTSINLKTLQIQQANFLQAKRKHDLQLLQERRTNQKTLFKLSVHIALLRKQMIEQGIDPVKVDEALKQFEQSVKIDNSIKNISGQLLWLDESSDLRKYLPDIHDYEKKTSK